MERRDFVKTMGIGAATIALGNYMLSACKTQTAEALPSFGLITGSGGAWHPDGALEGLKMIAEWGYTELEGGVPRDMQPSEFLELVKPLGLKPMIGSCELVNIIDEEKLLLSIKRAQELGQKYLTCYWPWTGPSKGDTIDGWKEVADNLNKGAGRIKSEGLTLIYHNHDMEFYPVEGQMPFDVMMAGLDPSIGIQLDLYWIARSGQDPIEYIKKYPGRYPVYHVKDMPANVTPAPGQGIVGGKPVTEQDFAVIGSGVLDFPAIFGLNQIAGAKHFIVESDRPGDTATFLEQSGKYLRELRF